MLYLVDMDDPAKAAALLAKADAPEAVRTCAPLAAKGAGAATEQLAGELGDWYAALAAKAEGYAKYLMLRRARAYYERFLALHEQQDVAQVRVTMALAKVDKELKALQPFNAPVELLSAVDVKRDAISGKWSNTPKGLWGKGDTYGVMALPGPEGSSYELTVLFTRTVGNNSVFLTLPVGNKQCVLILCGWDGATSGLSTIAGKQANDNTTTVKGNLITNGKVNTLRLIVRTSASGEASITVELNTKQLVSWQGKQAALSIGHPEAVTPRKNALAIGISVGEAIFHSARLVLLP
jgi:hypothetical protein